MYKKDKADEKSNYRPISLLCIPSKIMENVVADALTLHMTSNDLFSPFQWAYKKGLSSELLLTNMVEQWRHSLDNNNVVCVVFFDFKKAFDSIDHDVLLKKVTNLGVSDNICLWLADHLSERAQFTIANNASSNLQKVTYGVPQVSVLGPLLFFGSAFVKQLQHTRCLGINIDCKLSWSSHVDQLTKDQFIQISSISTKNGKTRFLL